MILRIYLVVSENHYGGEHVKAFTNFKSAQRFATEWARSDAVHTLVKDIDLIEE